MKNETDALDVMQETAYRAFKNIDTLRNPAYFKTWITKITINCALNVVKQNKKVIPLKQEYEEAIGTNEDLPLSLSLQDVIEKLTAEEKSVVLLKYYQDFTFQEIAEMMEIPLGTAKSILYRALKKLKRELLKGEDVSE